jgi:ParB/RepB/Spo0J family partition protein
MSEIELGKLFVGKLNVRKELGDITELVESIKQVGVLEPLIVRPIPNGTYEIIVGSRRYSAAKKAGLKKVPCTIKKMSDEDAIATSLIENIQRGDIGEEEVAGAYIVLHDLDPKKWTQEAFAKQVGKSHTWVSNIMLACKTLARLKDYGLAKGMKSYPKKEEREEGIVPLEHLKEIEYAVRSDEVKKLPENVIEKKQVELAKEVLDLPIEDAKKVIDRFKMYPEKPVQEIRQEALAKKTGVALETYLPPRIARELDKVAEERKASVEDILPDVVERGLKAQSEMAEEPLRPQVSPELIERANEAARGVAEPLGEALTKAAEESRIAKTSEERKLLENYMLLGSIIQSLENGKIFCTTHGDEEPILTWSCGTPITKTHEELKAKLRLGK